jgi:hypothetical protein
MHYMTHRSIWMQKHKFTTTCPGTLFVGSELGPPKHKNSVSTFHVLDCRGNVPRVACVARYSPKFWIQLAPSSGKYLGNHTPHTWKGPHHSRLKRRGHQSKRTNPGNYPCHHFSTLRLARADGISPPVYPSRLSLRPGVETRAPGQAYLGASRNGQALPAPRLGKWRS